MTTKKTFDFGGAYKELEGIVEWFENEEIGLDEGLTRFERGLELAQQCKVHLSEIENKVEAIKEKFGESKEV